MSDEIEAVYQNGVFRPLEPVELEEMQRVKVRLPDEKQPAKSNDEQPDSREDVEDDEIEPIWRGVFVTETKEKELFDKPLNLAFDKFPKLEPEVTLNPRWFEDEDDFRPVEKSFPKG